MLSYKIPKYQGIFDNEVEGNERGHPMAYIVWPIIGLVVATFVGAGPRRRAYRPNANGSLLAGAFGALIGGIVGDGIQHALAGAITLSGTIGAVIGSLIFCWAVRERTEDIEP